MSGGGAIGICGGGAGLGATVGGFDPGGAAEIIGFL